MKKVITSLTFIAIFTFNSFAGDWVLVTNKDNSMSSIAKADLKRVYTGKMKKVGGNTVIPIMLADNVPVTTQFLDEIVDKTPDAYKKFWVQQQIKGLGTAPMTQKTSAAAKLIAAGIPGALTYIEKSALDDTVKEVTVK